MRRILLWPTLLASALLTSVAGAATPTRGYVVSHFIPAMYNVSDSECPNGMNEDTTKLLERVLKQQGKSDDEIKAAANADTLDMYRFSQFMTMRGKADGKAVDVYLHPLSSTETLQLAVSTQALGFNLDGKTGPDKFTDPLTKETGVNNQMARILGCYTQMRGTPETRASSQGVGGIAAWLIAVDGAENLQNADNVTVHIYRALQSMTRGTRGIQANVTYTVDTTDPRMQNNAYQGRIKDGLFVSDKPIDFFMVTSQGYDDLKQSRLRISFKPDGTVLGFLGGFDSIKMLYVKKTQMRGLGEFDGQNFPAFFQTMLKLADTDIDKDSQTGTRTRISATYQLGGIPAFLRFPGK